MNSHDIFLAINLLAFLPIAILVASMPFVPQDKRRQTAATKRNNDHALASGFPPIIVRFMQTYQHLTVCTMQVTTAYLLLNAYFSLTGDSSLDWIRCNSRLILPSSGSIVAHFWTFVLWLGPFSIADREDFPADDKKTRELVRKLFYRPSMSPSCLFYILMHLQHTWLPLVPWVEGIVFPADVMCPPATFHRQLTMSAGYLLSWLVWALLVWKARNNPPYPVLRTAWRNGMWPVLYAAMIGQGIVAIPLSRTFASF